LAGLTPEQLQQGQTLLAKFVKKIELKVSGKLVDLTWKLEFPSEEMAKAFARGFQSQMPQSK